MRNGVSPAKCEMPEDKSRSDLFFEYIKDAGNVNGFVLKPIAASEAFRRYNFLRGKAAVNKAGNLRGMVINKKARTIYNFSSKTADRLAVLGVLIEMSKEWNKLEKVVHSDRELSDKIGRVTMMTSATILRSVTSVVPTAVELGALSLKGYGDLYSLISGSKKGVEFGKSAQTFASDVKAIHSRQWDGENWYDFVESASDRLFAPD